MSSIHVARRVIVFEDHADLAAALKDLLTERLGFDIAASASCLTDALRLARMEQFDVAVVDLDLQGVMAYPVLDELQRRGIPYVLATGTLSTDIPETYRAPVVCKPYSLHQLENALDQATSTRG
ncbi:response regulator [Luteibacter sp. ME-Dv--P-043b]|jgi:DNA-binding NarL/FixJ family response regulator|uniref:response regulator n=1 Tax=unclassified Luteibacter TaxID=2620188 RepID=UPI0025561B97|nr:response regulator [Luteibacter sp. ME-Dv--P-043b]